jgi:hypothetical protein
LKFGATISFKSLGTEQSVSKVLEQMPQNLWISTHVNPPPPVQCCVPFLVAFDVFWLEQHWLGWGEGEASGIVCKKLQWSTYNLKLHVSQELLKVIVYITYYE